MTKNKMFKQEVEFFSSLVPDQIYDRRDLLPSAPIGFGKLISKVFRGKGNRFLKGQVILDAYIEHVRNVL